MSRKKDAREAYHHHHDDVRNIIIIITYITKIIGTGKTDRKISNRGSYPRWPFHLWYTPGSALSDNIPTRSSLWSAVHRWWVGGCYRAFPMVLVFLISNGSFSRAFLRYARRYTRTTGHLLSVCLCETETRSCVYVGYCARACIRRTLCTGQMIPFLRLPAAPPLPPPVTVGAVCSRGHGIPPKIDTRRSREFHTRCRASGGVSHARDLLGGGAFWVFRDHLPPAIVGHTTTCADVGP